MKNAIIAIFAVAFLLFAGCASPSEQAPAPKAPASPAPAPAQNPAPAIAPVENQPAPSPEVAAPPSDTCTVEFQKDSSSIYYVMVKTGSKKQVAVACPNGKPGIKQGELYFCSQLDIPSPAIAYLGGEECGRLQFSKPAAASSTTKCTILLGPSRITAGQTSAVTVKTYVSEKSQLAYLCGGQEVTESISGMVDTGKICKFDTPGTISVYANVNGVECGSSLLSVFANPKDCSVFGSNLTMDKGEYVYAAKVAARGYSSTDKLIYKCYGISHTVSGSDIRNIADFVTGIECRSKSGPLTENVKVTMGGDACGEMVLAR